MPLEAEFKEQRGSPGKIRQRVRWPRFLVLNPAPGRTAIGIPDTLAEFPGEGGE